MVLEGNGIIQDVFRTGPHKDDPTIFIMVNTPVSSDTEPALRKALERIPGVSIQD